MDFGAAIAALKRGSCVARDGWNGKGMWLCLVPADCYTICDLTILDAPPLLPWIGMKTATGQFVPWLASQMDILAEDWRVVLE